MDKKDYLNPTTEVLVLESCLPVCQSLMVLYSGTLSSFKVDDYTPVWE